MTLPLLRAATLAAAWAIAGAPALADSLPSSASDSVSVSVGKLSDSVTNASMSSSPGQHRAEGDYRVIDMAEVEGRPGDVRVHLQPLPEGRQGEVDLTLPRVAAEAGRLRRGGLVTAVPRPYGIEFTAGEGREAFFLALEDDWMREMDTRPVARVS